MTITERINSIISERGMLKKAICNTLSISPSTFSTWISANSTSIPSEYIPPLADLFGITCDELLTGETKQTIDIDEQYLIGIFRNLGWEGKQIVLSTAIQEKRRVGLDEQPE